MLNSLNMVELSESAADSEADFGFPHKHLTNSKKGFYLLIRTKPIGAMLKVLLIDYSLSEIFFLQLLQNFKWRVKKFHILLKNKNTLEKTAMYLKQASKESMTDQISQNKILLNRIEKK